ncbi:FHA domain-containing protein [Ilumatobacter nonamiensis]|uniref:FHA domain-containing protein n=1 Tax=Ilumatobacter nonamiensis TaxID=467093 RepID=UPI00034A1A57|nr:FHA domain-containing protein [Ilumatobacter nonamiensis]
MPDHTNPDAAESDSTATEPSLEWGTSSFEPGSDVGLVARHTVGLIERDNPSTRERLWGLVADDAPLDDVLDELSSTGLKALPDFGIVQAEGANVRVVARGRASISAELSSGDVHEIDASGVRTWIEEVVADVVAITIMLPPSVDDAASDLSTEAFAVLAGSVPARSISRRFDVADGHASVAEEGWSNTPAWASPAESDLVDDPSTELDADADVELAMVEPADSSGDGDDWFDLEDAAPSESVPPQPVDAQVADPQPGPPPSDVLPASPQPGGPPAPGAGTPPPAATVIFGADDGPASSIFDQTQAPAVEAADDGDVASASASWGVLAFSNGVRIEVDRSVLIGRNPKVSGDVEGELPHLMKFDGPGQGLSRTHAEVRVEDGEIVLEDLQSTNGTEVELPGQQRRRVRSGEPVVVVPGTLIDFGEELHCTVEAAG